MSAQQLQHSKYGFSKTIDVPYAEAVEKTRAALKEEGFGVLSEIDIKEKLKEKLDVDFRNYVILGACNPPLAYKTLQEEINIGLSNYSFELFIHLTSNRIERRIVSDDRKHGRVRLPRAAGAHVSAPVRQVP